jgi:hypothetical protein
MEHDESSGTSQAVQEYFRFRDLETSLARVKFGYGGVFWIPEA